jgi:chromate reductase, NAD(P)H dehydrogenase (quinone)
MDRRDQYPVRVLIFSASLRVDSLNDRLALLARGVVERCGFEADHADFKEFDMQSYNEDLETGSGLPPGAEALRSRIAAADAFIIASPEYNASMPGVLKNAIDWVSRFRPQPFRAKHGLLMSASPSMAGGNRGLWSLRIPLEHLGAHIYPDMFSLAQAHKALDETGALIDPELRKRFEGNVECFVRTVEATKHYPKIKRDWVEFLGEHPDAATERVEEVKA